jgi:hemolysin activation/secretion protein
MEAKKLLVLTCLFMGQNFLSSSGYALPSGELIPGPAQSEQVSKALKSQEPKSQLEAPAAVKPPQPAEKDKKLLEAMKKIKFKLKGVSLIGNHVYSTEQLSVFYRDKINHTISIADVFTILQNITNFYRNNGYILTRAILPEQKVENGIVRLQVIEGYIGNVNVTGTPHGAKSQVVAFGDKILVNRPLQISVLQKYLLLANEIPSTQVKAVLEASHEKKPALGSSDLSLVTTNSPIAGYVSYDNNGSRYIGPQQMTGNISFNSFVRSGDQGQLTYTKTPKGAQISYLDANYGLPISNNGARLSLGITDTQSHPEFVLVPLQIYSSYNNYYLMSTFPIIRTLEKSLNLRASFNYLDSSSTILGDRPLYADHVRTLDLGANYNFTDQYRGANQIVGDIRLGLPILGYTNDFNPATAKTSRPGGRASYTKFTMSAGRVQALYGAFSLYGFLQGQWSFVPLLSTEQFSYGGSVVGRGYDAGEVLGDKGLGGTLELRYDRPVGRWLINTLQFYTFYDAGVGLNIISAAGASKQQSGTSIGAGMRFYMTKSVSGNFMWTQTLTKPVAAEDLIGRGRSPRTWFSVVATFG